jgi:hypothetical protein
MDTQPATGAVVIVTDQPADQRIKFGAVMHVDEVHDLMRDDGATDKIRGHRQPPTVANPAIGGATTPAGAGVSH